MIHLVVFAGQSNAEGFRMTAATLPAVLANFDYGQTYIWGAAHGAPYWSVLKPAQNTGDLDNPNAWAAELAYAYEFRKSHPDDILLIVKQASGSSGLAQDPDAADWSPDSQRELFHFMAATIRKARIGFTEATGLEAPLVSTVFWMQGEEDALDPLKAAAYHDNLAAFLARIRSDWMHDPQGKVIAGRVSDSALLPHNADVRYGQWLVDMEDPNFSTFKTIGYAMQPDGVHYGADGYVDMGRAVHQLWDAWF